MTNSAYLLNTQLVLDKKLDLSVSQIFGLSLTSARIVCRKFGFNANSYVRDMDAGTTAHLRKFILSSFSIQSTLTKQVQASISSLSAIKSVVGLRHKLKLPVHGQRTRTNHKTRKRLS